MVHVKKSEYIRISRTLVKKLFALNCFGKGSVYIHVLKSSISKEDIDKVEIVLEALIRQNIACKKKKANKKNLTRPYFRPTSLPDLDFLQIFCSGPHPQRKD